MSRIFTFLIALVLGALLLAGALELYLRSQGQTPKAAFMPIVVPEEKEIVHVVLLGSQKGEALEAALNQTPPDDTRFQVSSLKLHTQNAAELYLKHSQAFDADVIVVGKIATAQKSDFVPTLRQEGTTLNVTVERLSTMVPTPSRLLNKILSIAEPASQSETHDDKDHSLYQNLALSSRAQQKDIFFEDDLPFATPAETLKSTAVATLTKTLQDAVQKRLSRIDANRAYDFLVPSFELDERQRRIDLYKQAGEALGSWTINFAGKDIGGSHFMSVHERTKGGESLTRAAREVFERPVTSDDLLFFIDDVLRAGRGIVRDRKVYLTPSRLRNSGITLHPKAVFKNRPRRYPYLFAYTRIDEPKEPEGLVAAKDGEILGPNWYLRFANPGSESARLKALEKKNKSFAKRLKHLTEQLKAQEATVFIDSTQRAPERGYLMWGAFMVQKSEDEEALNKTLKLLAKKKREWKRKVDIEWKHPDGFEATVEAARQMADSYGVVYATERGARKSDHYDGSAADFTVVGLPRVLRLKAPNGQRKVFDLSGNEETRDLSLSPDLIKWVEKNYRFKKLKLDYPHWTDAKR